MREIMGKLKLTVNEEKTRICKVPQGEFDFLGYTFGRMYSARTGQARLGYRPSKKSIKGGFWLTPDPVKWMYPSSGRGRQSKRPPREIHCWPLYNHNAPLPPRTRAPPTVDVGEPLTLPPLAEKLQFPVKVNVDKGPADVLTCTLS